MSAAEEQDGAAAVVRPAIAWSALIDAAEATGADLVELVASEFLERVLDDAILGLVPGSGWPQMSYCTHMPRAAALGEFEGVVIFTAMMLAACPPCARDIRDEVEAGHHRTCQRCDEGRAAALHRAELSVAGVLLAIPLCEACEIAEGLRGTDLSVRTMPAPAAPERTR